MARPIRIDFVSDVVCPWCAVGLWSLKAALAQLDGAIEADIRIQPFELNPDMPAEGQNAAEHIRQKYGDNPGRTGESRRVLGDMGAALGFQFRFATDNRIWNTFDAHRLIYWAGRAHGAAAQLALKEALLRAHFERGEPIGEAAVLASVAAGAGLPEEGAWAVLRSGEFADEVRALEAHWRAAGVAAVPSVVFDGRWMVQGGQPPEAFIQAVRKVAEMRAETAETAEATS